MLVPEQPFVWAFLRWSTGRVGLDETMSTPSGLAIGMTQVSVVSINVVTSAFLP
jgi:hypothetical protein